MRDLSILIPARNEEFLVRTIQDILTNIRGNTEVIVVLDGYWPDPGIPQDERVTVLHYPESIGQRAATNRAAYISAAKYLMKVDAHCAFDEGFDVKLMEVMQSHWTLAPAMKNLHVFDWVCEEGHRRYQGPSGPCENCGKPTTKDVVWRAKDSPFSTSYCFDSEPHFQYFRDYSKRPESQLDCPESMSLQGSCFMVTREKYWELELSDESWGSWGSQGIEVACKTWLSGGEVHVNKNTWYAHMFRTQGGDFGFPYHLPGSQVEHAKKTAREIFYKSKWPKQKHKLSWLVKKFWPVLGWTDMDLANLEKLEGGGAQKGIVYYTCNTHNPEIDETCRRQLTKCGLPITCISLNKDLDFGEKKIRMDGEKSPLMLHKQVLRALEECGYEYVFLCESDVMYHPSHFNFTPKRRDVFYFNTNVWKVNWNEDKAFWTDDLQQLSGMCGSRELLLEFFKKRVEQIEREGFNRHYEPSAKQNVFPSSRGGKYGQENYKSEIPLLCIRHDKNLTKTKGSPEEFRDPKYAKGWKEATFVDGWPKLSELKSN